MIENISKLRVGQHSPSFLSQKGAANISPKKLKSLLPPMNHGRNEEDHKEYTLVLDLDETLVHFDQRRRNYRARPHAITFVNKMSKYFELVIFTAGLKDYADWILNDFDKIFIG